MPRMSVVSFKMAYRSISRRKFRSALTILGVIIGISTIVSLMTLGYGMHNQVKTTLNEMLGAGVIVSSKSGGVDIPEYIQASIQQVPGVNQSVPVITTMVYIQEQPIVTIGIDPQQASKLYHITLAEGRGLNPNETDCAILGETTASTLGIHINDTVTLSTELGGVGKSLRWLGF